MSQRGALIGALVAAFLGVGLGVAAGGAGAAAYALTLAPLSAFLGAFGGWRWRATGRAGWPGGLVSMVAGLATAGLLAAFRFRYSGATGVGVLPILARSREAQMVLGLLPGLALLGSGWGGRRPALRAAVGGVATSLIMGPILIGLAAVGNVPWLRPPAPAGVAILIVALLSRRAR